MEIIRGRLSAADFSNPSQRYNADTDTFQYTPDNGANWYDSPEADPRHSSIFRLPALTGGDPQCDAAANMVKWIKDFIDSVIAQLDADATALALTNNFLTTLTTLFPPALLLLLLQEAATSLFDTGATALAAAFTSTQYDLLLCAFYCNIGLDGQCSADQLTAVEVQIAATMDGTAAAIVDEILFIQGEVGLSNAGVIGEETGDCSGCDCAWCYRFNDTHRLGEWVAESFAGAVASYSGGVWNSAIEGDTAAIWISWTLASAISMTDAAVVAYTPTGHNRSIFVNGDGSSFSGTLIWNNGAIVGTPFPISVTRIDVYLINAHDSTAITLSEMQFSGDDEDNPFGENNC